MAPSHRRVATFPLLGVAIALCTISDQPSNAAPFDASGQPAATGQPQPPKIQRINEKLGTTGDDPAKAPKPLVAVAEDLNDLIALLSDDVTAKSPMAATRPSIFHREMIRQSLWIAAREDFGLRVRDASLGEAVTISQGRGDRPARHHWQRCSADGRCLEETAHSVELLTAGLAQAPVKFEVEPRLDKSRGRFSGVVWLSFRTASAFNRHFGCWNEVGRERAPGCFRFAQGFFGATPK